MTAGMAPRSCVPNWQTLSEQGWVSLTEPIQARRLQQYRFAEDAVMRLLPQSGFLALCLATLAPPAVLQAQQRSASFAGLRPNLAFIDDRGLGLQVTGYLGQPFTSRLAGLFEFGVTRARDRPFMHPCAFPPCDFSLPGETGISLAYGLQWYAAAGARRAAVTVAPGVVWLLGQPAGSEPVVPKLGGRCEVGWLIDHGPRVGFTLGLEWWGSSGELPRWVVPFGLTLGLR